MSLSELTRRAVTRESGTGRAHTILRGTDVTSESYGRRIEPRHE